MLGHFSHFFTTFGNFWTFFSHHYLFYRFFSNFHRFRKDLGRILGRFCNDFSWIFLIFLENADFVKYNIFFKKKHYFSYVELLKNNKKSMKNQCKSAEALASGRVEGALILIYMSIIPSPTPPRGPGSQGQNRPKLLPPPSDLHWDPLQCSKTTYPATYPGNPANPAHPNRFFCVPERFGLDFILQSPPKSSSKPFQNKVFLHYV